MIGVGYLPLFGPMNEGAGVWIHWDVLVRWPEEGVFIDPVAAAQAFSQRGVRVSFGHPIADFGDTLISIFLCITQRDVYFWTPNSEILAKALLWQ